MALFYKMTTKVKEILKQEVRGVLAVNGDGGYPYALPINYYFDEETAQKIGIEKLRNLQSAEKADGGWYLKLLDEPLDVDNPLHLEKQKQI